MKALIAILAIALAVQAQTAPDKADSKADAKADEEVYQVGPGVTPPRVLQQVQPEHPAKGFRISGAVLIGLVVSSKGEPKDVKVIKSLEKDIDQSAMDAVSKW